MKVTKGGVQWRVEPSPMIPTDRKPKTKTPGTYADIEALPVGWVGEIVDGTFYGHPRAAIRHSMVQTSLVHLLAGPFGIDDDGPGGWLIAVEVELHLGPHVLVPDLVGWRQERLPAQGLQGYPTLAPDWVFEILSPSTQAFDRAKKMPRYHSLGVGHAWLMDPFAQSLEIYERSERGWLLTSTHAGRTPVRPPPFDAVELNLDKVWYGEGPGDG